MKNLRVALYARVSTHEQNPDQQIHRLREYASARGWEVAGEFVDHGLSGKNPRRPEYQRLMGLARKRKVDAIAVVKLDRWGRSLSDLLRSTTELTEIGVAFVAVDQGLDLTTSVGRLQFQMLAAMAEFEAELIRERTIEGLHAARRRGTKLGPKFSQKISPGEARRAYEDEGLSLRAIAKRHGVGTSTVHRALERSRKGRVPQSGDVSVLKAV